MGCNIAPLSGTNATQEEQYTFTKPDDAKVTAAFDQYKTSDTAVIPEDKIAEALTAAGYTPDTSKLTKTVQLINSQKTLNQDEFYRLCYVMQNFDAQSNQYDKMIFMLADMDYSGKLSEEEIKTFVQKVETQIDSKALSTAINSQTASGNKFTFSQFNSIAKNLNIDFSKYFE